MSVLPGTFGLLYAECHTLLKKLSARRKFYTAIMKSDEKVLQFAHRIQQLASTLKSMRVTSTTAKEL